MPGQSPPAPAATPSPDSPQLSLADLDGEHRRLLDRAISRILSTEIAEITYAQIIDGLPTSRVAYDSTRPPHNDHPIAHAHQDLCPGMLEKARGLRHDLLRPETLMFSFKVSVEFPANSPPSPD
jgi:hypothetical protein